MKTLLEKRVEERMGEKGIMERQEDTQKFKRELDDYLSQSDEKPEFEITGQKICPNCGEHCDNTFCNERCRRQYFEAESL